MITFTVFDAVEEVYKKFPKNEYTIMYRVTFENDSMLFGYATVHKKMSGWSLESIDDDNYALSDIIPSYEYDEKENLIIVIVEGVWYK